MNRGMFWPILITTMLGAHVVAGIVVITVSVSDPSFAVEENYYEKAMDWDQTARQRATNDRLAWRVDLSPRVHAGRHPTHDVELTLSDATGAPLDGASVRIECFPNIRASERVTLNAATDANGHATVALDPDHFGLWEFRLRITHEDSVFTHRHRTQIAPLPIHIEIPAP